MFNRQQVLDAAEVERKIDQIEADLQEAVENRRQAELSEYFAHANMVQFGKYQERVTQNSILR